MTGIVDLWVVDPDEVRDPALVERYRALLSADERAQLDRFGLEHVRHRYLVSRALLRTALAPRAGLPPERLAFTTTPDGKPELDAVAGHPRVRFNLSHTDGAVVVAAARGDHAIGVDVEHLARAVDALRLARRFFAPAEQAALRALTEPARRRMFLTYWTLKEAYLKACGVGIAGRLDSIVLALEPGGALGAVMPPGRDETPSYWSLAAVDVTAHHRVAVALRTGAPGDLVLDLRWCLPLVREEKRERARVIASTDRCLAR